MVNITIVIAHSKLDVTCLAVIQKPMSINRRKHHEHLITWELGNQNHMMVEIHVNWGKKKKKKEESANWTWLKYLLFGCPVYHSISLPVAQQNIIYQCVEVITSPSLTGPKDSLWKMTCEEILVHDTCLFPNMIDCNQHQYLQEKEICQMVQVGEQSQSPHCHFEAMKQFGHWELFSGNKCIVEPPYRHFQAIEVFLHSTFKHQRDKRVRITSTVKYQEKMVWGINKHFNVKATERQQIKLKLKEEKRVPEKG